MRISLTVGLAILAMLQLNMPSSPAQLKGSTAPSNYRRLVFSDEFDDKDRSERIWLLKNSPQHGTDGHASFSPRSYKQSNGTFKLRVFSTSKDEHRTGWARPKGGTINGTRRPFDHKYGYIEARARFESASGQWGAFWLRSRDYQWQDLDPTLTEQQFLATHGALEIDIVEALRYHVPRPTDNRWNDRVNTCNPNQNGRLHPSVSKGEVVDYRNILVSAIHWVGDGQKKSCGLKRELNARQRRIQKEWHVYGLEWTPHHYAFYLDGELIHQTTRGVSQAPMYVNLSTHIKSGDFAGKIPKNGYERDPKVRAEYDWVRWWQE